MPLPLSSHTSKALAGIVQSYTVSEDDQTEKRNIQLFVLSRESGISRPFEYHSNVAQSWFDKKFI
jgi:hypothetical protein